MRTLPALALGALSACSGGPVADPQTTTDESELGPSLKIRDGDVTAERPEVGRISGCTATLVAADVAITAAHCLGYRTAARRGRYDTFRIVAADGATHRFDVERYRSFGRDLGASDIALLALAEPVPPDVARPAPIAADQPAPGTPLSVWGYGCTRIGAGSDGRKRFAQFEQGEASHHLCQGDSGGPVFNDETGEVLRTNSGYMLDRGRTDIYGEVPGLHAELLEQIEEWTADPDALPRPDDGLDPELPICGRRADLAIFDVWTCTPGRTHRYRCLPGGAPQWQACEAGCAPSPLGHDDLCAAAPCAPAYRDVQDWTCATDDRTLVRCSGGAGLESRTCALGCTADPGGADACD